MKWVSGLVNNRFVTLVARYADIVGLSRITVYPTRFIKNSRFSAIELTNMDGKWTLILIPPDQRRGISGMRHEFHRMKVEDVVVVRFKYFPPTAAPVRFVYGTSRRAQLPVN